MRRVFGRERAAMRNGGFQKRCSECRPIEGESSGPCAKAHYEARAVRREMVASKDDVLAAIGNADTHTISALRPEQHTSTGGVYYGRRSHIKGSANLAAMTTADENNAYKSAEDLRRLFAEPLSKSAVITDYGGGIAATADTLVLPMLGHNNVRLYDASLSEWARDSALPMQM